MTDSAQPAETGATPVQADQFPAGTVLFTDLYVLSERLGVWAGRDEAKAQPAVRKAGAEAMDAIDRLLGDLHAIRRRLLAQIQHSDDVAAARIDAMLGQHQDGGAR